MVADFGKNMYSDFTKYEAPKLLLLHPLMMKKEIEWLVRQIMSGLQLCDINTKGKKLLRKKYGKTWKSKLF